MEGANEGDGSEGARSERLSTGLPPPQAAAAAAEEEDGGSGSSGGHGHVHGSGGSGTAVSLWDAAFQAVRGLWLSGWNELGYWYATPEAWELKGNYRSLGYMRPLSVWALQWAIDKGGLLEVRAAEEAARAHNTAGHRSV